MTIPQHGPASPLNLKVRCRKTTPTVIVFLAAAIFLGFASAAFSEQITLCTAENQARIILQGSMEFVRKGFEQIGSTVEFIYLSPKRCETEANAGRKDGICARIDGMEGIPGFTSLVKVPESLVRVECKAWSLDPTITIDNLQSLEEYRVAYVRGVKIVEDVLENIPASESLFDATSRKQAFQMLVLGRVDVVLDNSIPARTMLDLPEFQGKGIIEHPLVLATKTLHIYLHKSHSALVLPLAQALRELKEDGTYKRLAGEEPPY